MKVLILGGYGVFGGRLAELLSDEARFELIIAGRSIEKAAKFCAAFKGAATVVPLALDRDDIAVKLPKINPDVIVDASGPFQAYGDTPYGVVEAAIKAKIPYLDFADAADFVFGIDQFDDKARAVGIPVLSGVSSFPVLTGAVLEALSDHVDIVHVEAGIAPSPFAGIGLNVMRAVVGYAGGDVKLTRNATPHIAKGLTESRRRTVCVPGRLPLKNIRYSLVDVPDLQVLPNQRGSIQNIWMGAGPVPEILHRVLNVLAYLRAKGVVPSLVPFSPLFYRVLNLLKFGEHRGGMYVAVSVGSRDISWNLLAEGDDGPYIPSMAIEILLRKMLNGDMPQSGARAAVGDVSLADYDKAFESKSIHTGLRTDIPDAPLYRRLLGDRYTCLPEPVQALHDLHDISVYSGTATVTRGRNPLGWCIGKILGLPPAGKAVPVTVTMSVLDGVETWQRNFGGHCFSSQQSLGTGRWDGLIVERFGVFRVGLAVLADDDKLELVARRMTILGLPVPNWCLPNGPATETESDGAFSFDVSFKAPFLGELARYQGRIAPLLGANDK